MLTKSKKGALIMGSIESLTSFVTGWLIRIITHLSSGKTEPGIQQLLDELTTAGAVAVVIAIILFALVWRIGLAAIIIFSLDETHFGRAGAIRWAIFGIIRAFLNKAVAPYMSQELLSYIIAIPLVILSYWLVFKLLLPVHKKAIEQSAP